MRQSIIKTDNGSSLASLERQRNSGHMQRLVRRIHLSLAVFEVIPEAEQRTDFVSFLYGVLPSNQV